MSITKGIPEGERISLQKAVTWAFYGWSLAGDLSRKEIEELDRLADYPAPGSIYHSLPELRQDSKKRSDFWLKFEHLFNEACAERLLPLTGRKTGETQSISIPHKYFDRQPGEKRGLDVWGDKSAIMSMPSNSSLDLILRKRHDGDVSWEDVWVDIAKFTAWFDKAKALLLGLPPTPLDAEGDLAGNVPSQDSAPTVSEIGLTRKDINEVRQIRRVLTIHDRFGAPLKGKQLVVAIALRDCFGSDAGRGKNIATRVEAVREWHERVEKAQDEQLPALPTQTKDISRLIHHVDKKLFTS